MDNPLIVGNNSPSATSSISLSLWLAAIMSESISFCGGDCVSIGGGGRQKEKKNGLLNVINGL